MAEEALVQIRRGPADPNDMTGTRGTGTFSFDSAIWDAMIAIADGALQLKDFTKANSMISEMQRWVDDNRFKQGDLTTGYERFRGRYFHYAGAVQEAQGRKLDALALYLMGIAFPGAGEEQHAREMWFQAGGSAEVWMMLTHRPAPAVTAGTGMTPLPPAAGIQFAPWTPVVRSVMGRAATASKALRLRAGPQRPSDSHYQRG